MYNFLIKIIENNFQFFYLNIIIIFKTLYKYLLCIILIKFSLFD